LKLIQTQENKMGEKVKIVIIGAGSAGLSAMRQVKKVTNDFLIVDNGPLGTKCARVGCMPSKALISAANDFHRRKVFEKQGIIGSDKLTADIPAVLRHVRELRDNFSSAMKETIEQLAGEHLVKAQALITSPNTVIIGAEEYTTEKIIIASGARSKMLADWKRFGHLMITTDDIFELDDIPQNIAVLGLGVIGLELGQALSRLGIKVTGYSVRGNIGGITDPQINKTAIEILEKDFPMYLGAPPDLRESGGKIEISHPQKDIEADAAVVAIGIEPDLKGLGLENLGINLDDRSQPKYNRRTMQIENLPVFMAGDANGCRPILHEALDEGLIAGYNAANDTSDTFCRRNPLRIVFTHPQIASTGLTFKQLSERKKDFVIGKADITQQARAALELKNEGLIHIYAEKETGLLLGSEMICPEGEHLAHLLCMAIQNEMTVFDMLKLPYYHPTIEEALRTAMRDAAYRISGENKITELGLCQSCPEQPLC
jgi:dihydrolipoamide dehydrogenase